MGDSAVRSQPETEGDSWFEPAQLIGGVKRREELAPKTIANHLRTLSAMFEYARRRRRMTVNPVGLLEALAVPTQDTPVLREEEVAALLNAYRLAQESATPDDAEWWTLARRLTVFALGRALRRGEILALRWQDVEMLERRLHVRRSLVRGVRRAEEQGGKADDQLRAADRRRAPRAVPGEPLPVAGVARVLPP